MHLNTVTTTLHTRVVWVLFALPAILGLAQLSNANGESIEDTITIRVTLDANTANNAQVRLRVYPASMVATNFQPPADFVWDNDAGTAPPPVAPAWCVTSRH